MFKVITKNSVYLVTAETVGFRVSRVADLWGRAVTAPHTHNTHFLSIQVGAAMVTTVLTTSDVVAVVPA